MLECCDGRVGAHSKSYILRVCLSQITNSFKKLFKQLTANSTTFSKLSAMLPQYSYNLFFFFLFSLLSFSLLYSLLFLILSQFWQFFLFIYSHFRFHSLQLAPNIVSFYGFLLVRNIFFLFSVNDFLPTANEFFTEYVN